jgi:hypothetical protein
MSLGTGTLPILRGNAGSAPAGEEGQRKGQTEVQATTKPKIKGTQANGKNGGKNKKNRK